MAYTKNTFCWHGIISTDVDKAVGFYNKVLGWDTIKQPMGDEMATMFAVGGIPRAHIMAPPMDGVPSHWSNYIKVEDVDASAAAAVANGGKLMVPATDIPPGRFAVVTSPSGAAISLFLESDTATATDAPKDDVGAIHWTELHSHGIDADLAWLKATFGLETSSMDMGEMGTYHVLQSGETQTGGAMTANMEGAPSMWLSWVRLPDVDEAVGRVSTHGGNVLSPVMDVPGIGRMAVVQDNTGGVFGVITPAQG